MSLLLLLRSAPTLPTAHPPGYWRGTPWIGHPKANWPTDGAYHREHDANDTHGAVTANTLRSDGPTYEQTRTG